MGLELHVKDKSKKNFIITAYHPDSDHGDDIHKQFLESLTDLYSRAPKDAVIISGEDINAQLGRNVLQDNEDPSSLSPFHKVTGPFSSHLHSNNQGNCTSATLATQDLTSAATWFQKHRYDTFYSHLRKSQNLDPYLQLDHFFVSYSAQKLSLTVSAANLLFAVTTFPSASHCEWHPICQESMHSANNDVVCSVTSKYSTNKPSARR
mmetsp:Transcript_914/g.1466  ORF Transcript_914/g.1466 Transcript_914/m.1466 type:complete len:207 (-) Transcript_914:14-634(-)